jgi:hypothetical protein
MLSEIGGNEFYKIEKMKYLLALALLVYNQFCYSQRMYPIDLYIPELGYLTLTNDLKLKDTVTYVHSRKAYFKYVIFDPRGEAYFEVYKNGKLFSKGNYKNSVDTFKAKASPINYSGKGAQDKVHEYFTPVKHGEWLELVGNRYVTKRYNMGIECQVRNK